MSAALSIDRASAVPADQRVTFFFTRVKKKVTKKESTWSAPQVLRSGLLKGCADGTSVFVDAAQEAFECSFGAIELFHSRQKNHPCHPVRPCRLSRRETWAYSDSKRCFFGDFLCTSKESYPLAAIGSAVPATEQEALPEPRLPLSCVQKPRLPLSSGQRVTFFFTRVKKKVTKKESTLSAPQVLRLGLLKSCADGTSVLVDAAQEAFECSFGAIELFHSRQKNHPCHSPQAFRSARRETWARSDSKRCFFGDFLCTSKESYPLAAGQRKLGRFRLSAGQRKLRRCALSAGQQQQEREPAP